MNILITFLGIAAIILIAKFLMPKKEEPKVVTPAPAEGVTEVVEEPITPHVDGVKDLLNGYKGEDDVDWLLNYTWRKQITITGTVDGAQTNRQLLLNIVKGDGADSGNTVYLDSAALAWPNDIRFTKSDGVTQLDFWREESDATDGTWWIEFDSIPVSPNTVTFWLYYGKASDTDASSVINTFISQGDDMERGNDGDAIGGNWQSVSGSVTIDTGQKWGGTRSGEWARVSGTGANARYPVTASANIAIRFRLRKGDAPRFFICLHGNGTKYTRLYLEADEDIMYTDDVGSTDIGNVVADTWHLFELRNFNWTAYTYDIVLDGAVIKSGAGMYTSTLYSGKALFLIDTADGSSWVDDFIVRNWSATDPTFSAWGTAHKAPITFGYIIG